MDFQNVLWYKPNDRQGENTEMMMETDDNKTESRPRL